MGSTFTQRRLFLLARGMIQTKVILVPEARAIMREAQKVSASENARMKTKAVAQDLQVKITVKGERAQLQ